jgi:molybdopterin molybdotransferase
MISLEEAFEKILAEFRVLDAETKPILEAQGQVLAEDIVAGFNIPPLTNAAMDGFAVRAADVAGASESRPVTLPVISYVAAGHVADRPLEPGTAIRIMTGAPIPPGADTVVPFEDTNEQDLRHKQGKDAQIDRITILKENPLGQNTRKAGEDVRTGELIMAAGRVIRPAEIGVLASLGYSHVRVIRRPIVSVLATGDELVPPGGELQPGQIFDANQYSVAAQVTRYGGIPRQLGIARDTLADLEAKIQAGVREGDLLLTSAGVSLGDYDIVKEVLAKHGEIRLWTVAIRPGKPLAFGTLTATGPDGKPKTIPHLGLPGNPVSAMVTFELYARPAILKMLGKPVVPHPSVEVELMEDIKNYPDRRFFARAIVTDEDGRYVARLTGPQGSGILTSMSLANALVVIPEGVELAPKGSKAQALMLDWTHG